MFRFNRARSPAPAILILSSLAIACSGKPKIATTTPAGCVRVDRGRAPSDSTAVTEDVRAGRVYTCVLETGESPIHVTLVADSAANSISRIELRRRAGDAPFETLSAADAEPPYRNAEFFVARDLDGDGVSELMLLTAWGATGNNFYRVWRRMPDASAFALDSTLSVLASPTPVPGRPCVSSRSTGGHAGNIYNAETICREAQTWVRVLDEDQRWEERAKVYIHTVRERRGDSLVVTRVDTVRDTTLH